MGGKCPHRSVKKRRYSHKTHRRAKFLVNGDDMVYDSLNKADEQTKPLPPDQDLPGMGQFYCLHCDWVLFLFRKVSNLMLKLQPVLQ
ncbi:hypothetical protein PRUPE_7G129700 [Prunus persica]|uniref:Uncharacterized protein n=1 Tax=Prunus persica TaxID=3760 RepID=M5WB07_PRUPE|nr:hypothetical protein PRUPE_7G129700 [Prunus persica]